MRKYITFIFFAIIFNIYSIDNFRTGKITFNIVDKVVKDGSFATLKITNNTTSNYFLPILNNQDSIKLTFTIAPIETSLFLSFYIKSQTRVYEKWVYSANCFSHDIDEVKEKLYEFWEIQKKNLKIEDFVLLKSGETITIKVPVNLIVKLSDDCYCKLVDYNYKDKLMLSFFYNKKMSQEAYGFLGKHFVNEIKRRGYKLCTQKILSNKVVVMPDNLRNSAILSNWH